MDRLSFSRRRRDSENRALRRRSASNWANSSTICLEYFGSPFHVGSPLHPVIRQLEWAAGIVRTDSVAEKLDKLERLLEGSTESRAEVVPLFATLLSISFGQRYSPLQINEQVQKQRTMEALLEQLVLLSSRGPLLLVFEDAHWIDPTSLEFISAVVRRVTDLCAMVIVTHRPEFAPPWLDFGHVTMLKLSHLGRSQVVELVHNAAGSKALPDPIVEQIAARSQGVPLFVEEITRSIVELGDLEESGERYVVRQSSRDFAIPATLQDFFSCEARSTWLSQRCSAYCVDHRQGVFLRADRGFVVGISCDLRGGSQPLGTGRSARAARHTAPFALYFQACADPRRRLSYGLEGAEAGAA